MKKTSASVGARAPLILSYVAITLLLAACGQKGPLKLPPAATPATSATPAASAASAAPASR
jgi:predicted small lipoprotein YifL